VTEDRNASARRRDALQQLLHPRQLKDSLALSKQPSLRNAVLAGAQAAATAAIVLPLVHMSPWPHLIGFASLGVLVALFGRFAPARGRRRIVFFCGLWQVMTVFVMSGMAWIGAPEAVQLVLLALACGLFLFVCVTGQFGAPGPLIFIFAAGASMATELTLEQLAGRVLATALAAALAWAVCAGTEAFRQLPTAVRPLPVEPERPLSHRLTAAVRSTAGAGIAIFASHAIGADHPEWAAMGALAVMQGAHLHITMNRAVQRMAGTVLGATLAWLLLLQEPSIWSVIAVLVVLQLLTEIVIGINYAFGQVFVTPMALLMTHLANPQGAGLDIAAERVVSTLLGATIGIAMSVLLSTVDDRRHLAAMRAGGGEGGKP
jgi:hypothetical protein